MGAPYRIAKPSLQLTSGGQVAEYTDRLMKLIPTEVVTIYLAGYNVIPAEDQVTGIIWACFCLVGVVIVRWLGTREPGSGPQLGVIAISAIAFLIWVYSMGGPFVHFGLYVPYIGTLLILGWTFLTPILYRG
jgi:hypothetical protein